MHTIKLNPIIHNKLEELLGLPLTNLTLPTFQSALMSIESKIDRTDLELISQLGRNAIDVCGTGGSGVSKFNTSTTVAFILAGLGIKVTKFGNRSATGQSGSADFLEALGFTKELRGEDYLRVFRSTDLVFLNAQSFFPQLSQIREKRSALGHATIFNFMGPLLNPAKPAYRLLGVSNSHMHAIIDRHLQKDKVTVRALTVRAGNVDELMPYGTNSISLLHRGDLHEYELESRLQATEDGSGPSAISARILDLDDFRSAQDVVVGLTRSLACPQVNSPDPSTSKTNLSNTEIFHAIINGDDVQSKHYETVVLNAAAGLFVMGLAANLEEGQQAVKQCLSSGKATRKFEQVRRFYQ